jgi:ketosteroid isomerase-like protein
VVEVHRNVLIYLEIIDAFNRGDLDSVRAGIVEDFVYRIPGQNPIAGEYRGIEGFAGILRRLRDETDGTIAQSPSSVLADDDNLIARARVSAERNGKRLDTENCYAFRFIDGRLADARCFSLTQSRLTASSRDWAPGVAPPGGNFRILSMNKNRPVVERPIASWPNCRNQRPRRPMDTAPRRAG